MNSTSTLAKTPLEGLVNVDKPSGVSSFAVVDRVKRHSGVKRVGHAGTLDPFASGVLLVLVGRAYTRLSDLLMACTKKYLALVHLGQATDTYDCLGQITATSDHIPTLAAIQQSIEAFCGEVWQVPPMYSAKKINGQRLYKLARQGIVQERQPVLVNMQVRILQFAYPDLHLEIVSGKGAYMRSLAHDLGQVLGCCAHLKGLVREQCGPYAREASLDGRLLFAQEPIDLRPHYQQVVSDFNL